ncbi:hypothetical protein [Novosphingobium olei]|uniref:VRR-NUC domain-containing protein n=1 Tax=Novosphingobium olei TaxID=2728851 RepID=A0A7Y0G998_9SPHN|nr:hypothetical protein [Novosphingobium olei]NML93785.1 hypothetical protein [Novosphingobium olei]
MQWADLESALDASPLFPVERPDGRKHLSELARVIEFRDLVRTCTRGVHVHAIPNAAKRGFKAQAQAKKEGMVAGVFDLCVTWQPRGNSRGVAWPEFKGYDASGKAGSLSQAQIDWGNAHFRMGHAVACFFSPERALEWLASHGAPVVGRIAA